MLFHTIAALHKVERVSKIIVIISPYDHYWSRFTADWASFGERLVARSVGGDTRAQSVANGLQSLADELAADDWVMVHDAARPCINSAMIDIMIDELRRDEIGGLLAVPLADTIKQATPNLRVATTMSREGIWCAQTPQMFRYGILREALAKTLDATDEAQAVEALGHQPKLVMGAPGNLKITYPGDMQLARLLLVEEMK